MNRYLLIIFLFVINVIQLQASHIRAGEILTRKKGYLQYEFTVIIYRNTKGISMSSIELHFGDNTSETKSYTTKTDLNDDTEKYTFVYDHTYGAPTNYKVFINVINRNEGIENISNSRDVSFYVESLISIDPLLGSNTSPSLLAPPIDKGNKDRIFTHNPGAWDPDGDSLAFKLITPKWMPGDTAETVPGFQQLNNYCNSTFTLDPKTGTLTWDKPCKPLLYNIAFEIEEFRNGIKIGYITRDMQIEILENQTNNPDLIIPSDTCITSGMILNTTVTGRSVPASDDVWLYAFGGVFSLANSPASAVVRGLGNPSFGEGKMFFTWQTNCSHVRDQPYLVAFKAEVPQGNEKLAVIKDWSIKVSGPSPKNLSAVSKNKQITLNWDSYACSNATKIIIMRKDCPEKNLLRDSCTIGSEATKGYEKVGEVNANVNTFTDTNKGKGLKIGALYCYVIYAVFPEPSKGESRPSLEICEVVASEAPISINVDIDSTDNVNGSVIVRWLRPKEIDSSATPPPYTYELWRINNTDKQPGINVKTTQNLADTTFIDAGINTGQKIYSYFTKFYFGSDKTLKETSDTASIVRLSAVAKNNSATLYWYADTPWDNKLKQHYIYRKNETTGKYILADSVLALSDTVVYTTYNLKNDSTYSFYIATQGSYVCPDGKTLVNIPYLLTNRSQRIEVIPTDTNRPCPPSLRLVNVNCNQLPVNMRLYWNRNLGFTCDSLISRYNVYFTNSSGSPSLIASINDTSYIHPNGSNEYGCYSVKAVTNKGLESPASNAVCTENENCDFDFQLPNIFTPNGDNKNDLLVPKTSTQIIESIVFDIYNRWGMKIFNTSDPGINWSGENQTDGLYYYRAIVTFKSTRSISKTKEFNGWVQLLR